MTDITDSTVVSLRELKDAAARMLKNTEYWASTGDSMARGLVLDAIEHREPEWQPRDIVKAADNTWYIRVHRLQQGAGWERFGQDKFIPHDEPRRPLKLMGRHG